MILLFYKWEPKPIKRYRRHGGTEKPPGFSKDIVNRLIDLFGPPAKQSCFDRNGNYVGPASEENRWTFGQLLYTDKLIYFRNEDDIALALLSFDCKIVTNKNLIR